MEFKIDGYDYIFRIARMNAIQVLAFQSQIKDNSFEAVANMINIILENLEVKLDNTWFSVKEKNREVYYPASLENDVVLTRALVKHFMNNYLTPVFQKSDV